MPTPTISIITPIYNAEPYIAATIESVCSQTFTDWEMVLVDDCSTDGSTTVIRSLMEQDERIRLHTLERNAGAAAARNKGLELARGRYIAFLDSDDLWTADKLEKQLAFMQENNCGFSFTAYELMNQQGQKTGKFIEAPPQVNYRQLLKTTAIGCLTVMIDKEIIGDFRMPEVRAGQDTATWLSILRQGHQAYGLNKSLACYRQVPGSISSNKWKALQRTWNTYRNLEKLPFHQACYYFGHYVVHAVKRRL